MKRALENEWKPFEELLTISDLKKVLSLPLEFAAESPEHVIPNVQLGTGGPVLRSVLFTTKTLIGEAHIGTETNFDFGLLEQLENFRLTLSRHEVPLPNPPDLTTKPAPAVLAYDTAKITLLHGGLLKTEISYVGSKREYWVSIVKKALPLSLLKASRRAISQNLVER